MCNLDLHIMQHIYLCRYRMGPALPVEKKLKEIEKKIEKKFQ